MMPTPHSCPATPRFSRRVARPLLVACVLAAALTLVGALHAQGGDLIARTNALRASRGLPPYNPNGALSAAAQAHAQWMAATGNISHSGPDGSTPRQRAVAAGYPSSFVSENIYGGTNANADVSWNFWVNSAIHLAGLTNPGYTDVGVGVATGAAGTTFVMVFGSPNPPVMAAAPARSGDSGGGARGAAAAPPSFVVGQDARGNIMHEVQPGDTLGHIALLYGYTWPDLPYMMEINEIDPERIRTLQIGSVFLVPPRDGTFTPTPGAPPTATPGATDPAPPSATMPPGTLDALPADVPSTFGEPDDADASAVMPTPWPTETLSARRIATVSAWEATTPTPAALPGAAAPDLLAVTQAAATAWGPTPLPYTAVSLRPTSAASADDAVALAALPTATHTPSLLTTRTSPPPSAPQQGRSPWLLIGLGVNVLVLLGAGVEFLLRRGRTT